MHRTLGLGSLHFELSKRRVQSIEPHRQLLAARDERRVDRDGVGNEVEEQHPVTLALLGDEAAGPERRFGVGVGRPPPVLWYPQLTRRGILDEVEGPGKSSTANCRDARVSRCERRDGALTP